jgi:2-polyprenyl-3-methyl-5-hydroxy-6-metoxy-1,4-benzoquinol methylase
MDSTSPFPLALRETIDPAELSLQYEDLGLDGSQAHSLHEQSAPGTVQTLVALVAPGQGFNKDAAEYLVKAADDTLTESGALLLFMEGRRPETELAAWRNSLWPMFHANVIYIVNNSEVKRRTLGGTTTLDAGKRKSHKVRSGSVLFLRRRVHAMGPDATILKFDQNASGWNGNPGGAGYPHFRWMRRFVGCFTGLSKNGRILDFGCGAGWCGIEAAKAFGASELAFFDPSPEMVKIADRNAREQGIQNPVGRTGFGEEPPFPAAGEEAYDSVISSGVISFSPDPKVWVDGLIPTVKKGGTLIIGDIQRTSRGMQRRRREKALLPARELNAQTAAEVRAQLESHGFEYTGGAGYQLTRPFPEAMHVNETKLKGLLTWPLLWSNQIAATTNRRINLPGNDQFDSWVMSFRRK